MIRYNNDYNHGAHPAILQALAETNDTAYGGYGEDEWCDEAVGIIRGLVSDEYAQVHFLVGGTQTNYLALEVMLRMPYESVIAADTGHISVHESGAIENTGHKVHQLRSENGKLTAEQIAAEAEFYASSPLVEHITHPKAVYISYPTEFGTVYSLEELEAIRKVCDQYGMYLFIDGARLGYGLASTDCDLTIKDIHRLADAFYIGGTKCGALFGEAVVVPKPEKIPHLFTIIKQHGALMAKGRLLGIQFDELFRDDLYMKIGKPAIESAERIRKALQQKRYRFYFDSPTNQIFVVVENDAMKMLGEKVEYGFWEKYDDDHTVIRFATDWATTEAETNALIDIL